jgi:hypothetical protein
MRFWQRLHPPLPARLGWRIRTPRGGGKPRRGEGDPLPQQLTRRLTDR